MPRKTPTAKKTSKSPLNARDKTSAKGKKTKKPKKRFSKKARVFLSAYSIIMILVIILGLLSHSMPEAQFNDQGELINGSGVLGATLSQVLMAPLLGFQDAVGIIVFILILGGMLAIVTKTKALETGVRVLVGKMKGKEIWLIPILMFVFSIMGSTYGFLEESIGFYALLAATMFAAGMDPLVGAATVLLGAGVGVIGSTVNPFATGVITASVPEGVEFNQGKMLLIGVALWLVSYLIATFFVMRYARKVIRDKGSTFLSLREQQAAVSKYGKYAKATNTQEAKLTKRQGITLIIFALAFIVMIVGFIPWQKFGITFFDGFTGWLTGQPLGQWFFYEAALWFLIISIIIAIVNRSSEHAYIDTFIKGAADMVGVILVIAVARGVSILMVQLHFDNFIIYNAATWLAALPELAFVPLDYILHLGLSFLVPSSSGLAGLSAPITVPLAAHLGYSTEVAAMNIVAANGLVNLITPTCGAIMGGLALAQVEYTTWVKWAWKVVLALLIAGIAVLCLFTVF